MDPKRQVKLAEDKSQLTQVSGHFSRINFTVIWTARKLEACAVVTWDQAQFSFRSVITFRRARRNENRAWYKPSTKRLPPTFLIGWHLLNQPTKITSVASFSSMQIFHAWEKCRLADLKNSFFHLKIKQSAQSHLTSWEIKEDLKVVSVRWCRR